MVAVAATKTRIHRNLQEFIKSENPCYSRGFHSFAEIAGTIVLLLCAGDKSSQPSDIDKAKGYWAEYRHRAVEV
jgi:hypothetical protein